MENPEERLEAERVVWKKVERAGIQEESDNNQQIKVAGAKTAIFGNKKNEIHAVAEQPVLCFRLCSFNTCVLGKCLGVTQAGCRQRAALFRPIMRALISG